MSVFVCVPTEQDILGLTTASVFRICAGFQGGVEFRTMQAKPTDFSRNLCVEAFLKTNHSHILFIDSDIVAPDDCLQRMLMEDKPIVSGIYPLLLSSGEVTTSIFQKMPNSEYKSLPFPIEWPFFADAAGMGCCLIERSVFDRVHYPWFEFSHLPGCKILGEDFDFFEKCNKVGIKPYVHNKIICSHYKTIDLMEFAGSQIQNQKHMQDPWMSVQ